MRTIANIEIESISCENDRGRGPGRRRAHSMPHGAEFTAEGHVRFRLWAPGVKGVEVAIEDSASPVPMRAEGGGWFELVTDRAIAGTRYRFLLPDGTYVPDPASRFQPADVHGPSEVIDPSRFPWDDAQWQGRPWHEAILYELHIGAFTPQGTFLGAIEKLDHLAALGVTAIEIMPIGDFSGARNWGYDGVLPYAPDNAYGRPEDFKALIAAAHKRGLMVVLDVIYNHFGPDGNFLSKYAPQFFTQRHQTPWGAAINYDGIEAGPVRDFVVHNALYWLEEYHLDGLRLDAVHAIIDERPVHLLDELASKVREAVGPRQVHLILENEENHASRLARSATHHPVTFTAQWNDDVHHVLHTAITGEASGYYGEYCGDSEKLGRALAQGFAFQGEMMAYRGSERGEPCDHLPPAAFIGFLQNHDQIGNRAFGDRLSTMVPASTLKAAAAIYLLLPQIPLLFMGEEWGAKQPFPFFCDFSGELADAVRDGRRAEFARFPEFSDPDKRARIPDPLAPETFLSAKLEWKEAADGPHAVWLEWYRRVLALRREVVIPRLPDIAGHAGTYVIHGPGAVTVHWTVGTREVLTLDANLSDSNAIGFASKGEVVLQEGRVESDGSFGPWTVRWSLSDLENEAADPEVQYLDELAERCGIESEFRDALGEMQPTSQQTKRALLGAMGWRAQSAADCREALTSLEDRLWRGELPPVSVIYSDRGAPQIDLILPASTSVRRWRVRLEHGGETSGEIDFHALPLEATRVVDGVELQRRALRLDGALPWGYHRLELEGRACESTLIVSPGACWLPEKVGAGGRLWGLAAQVYLLRSEVNWGIGDYSDLRKLVTLVSSLGGDVVGVNPLHALFVDDPEHASPYSPASRLLLNVLNIDVMAIPELALSGHLQQTIDNPQFSELISEARRSPLVLYDLVAQLKLPVLKAVYAAFAEGASAGRKETFAAFRAEGGQDLERGCVFQALRAYFAAKDPSQADWRQWPEEFRSPQSSAVQEFVRQHTAEVEYWAWLQWIADEQLASAAAAADDMAVGIYRDLAVGADPAGAETWVTPDVIASHARVGAPPDIINTAGQNWGLPPLDPEALRDTAYRSFVSLLRANMRHAGALRIDHVMALQRLYWIPSGLSPAEGAYIRYPLEDLVGILALESHRNRCLVVGEDLGTVPEGFRERMTKANILSYRVLFFEKHPEPPAFLAPADYPGLALGVAGSHDLPTLCGWWQGTDLALRAGLGLASAEVLESHAEERAREREQLRAAFVSAGLLSEKEQLTVANLAQLTHAFLARSGAALALAQIDDISMENLPVNVPATTAEHPNWRRKISITLEELANLPEMKATAAAFNAERSVPTPADS